MKKSIRDSLRDYENDLQAVVSKFDQKSYNEHDYQLLSEVLKFITDNTDNLNSTSLKNPVFLLGATGAGKSTLLNYLTLGDSGFVISNKQHDIKLLNETSSIAEIGKGKGSTTLFPNMITLDFGNFLDCAGEGDTSGILAETINAIVKMKISAEVEQAKILFVSQQSSLGASGGYGANFKQALDKNAQFFKDINYFKDSIGFVITKADFYNEEVLIDCIENLENILKNHSNLDSYRDTIQMVLSNKNIVTFSGPPDQSKIDEFYSSPSWNPNQRENIINMIKKIPFSPIPHKDFFNSSSTPEVREVMNKAMQVLQLKAGDWIKNMVVSAQPFTIYSVEMKPFAKYISGLSKSYPTELSNYIKVLSFNNYLKIKPDYDFLNKLDNELKFLMQFTQKTYSKSPEKNNIDWGDKAGIKEIFSTAYERIQKIILMEGNNFAKFKTEGNIVIKSTSGYSDSILQNFSRLYQEYKNLDALEILSQQQASIYYKNVTKKEFSHKKSVPYNEKEKYIDTINETVQESYQELEPYTVKETKTRYTTKWKTEKYYENQDQWEKVTKYKTETYQTEETAVGRTIATHLLTFGIGTFGKALFTGSPEYTNTVTRTREVPYEDWEKKTISVEKTREVPYQVSETYYEDVRKEKLVTKYRNVTKPKQVTKERDVTKYREEDVYKDLIVREFDKIKYDQTKNELSIKINNLRTEITKDIQKYPKGGVLGIHNKESIFSKDKYEKMYEDLETIWQNAEYEAYFANNPSNSLAELDIEVIGNSE